MVSRIGHLSVTNGNRSYLWLIIARTIVYLGKSLGLDRVNDQMVDYTGMVSRLGLRCRMFALTGLTLV